MPNGRSATGVSATRVEAERSRISSRARSRGRALLARDAPAGAAHWRGSRSRCGSGADHDVVEHLMRAEQREVLEGAADAERGDAVARHLRAAAGRRTRCAAVAVVEAGQAVEQGGLAGAVGADQAGDLARRDVEARRRRARRCRRSARTRPRPRAAAGSPPGTPLSGAPAPRPSFTRPLGCLPASGVERQTAM